MEDDGYRKMDNIEGRTAIGDGGFPEWVWGCTEYVCGAGGHTSTALGGELDEAAEIPASVLLSRIRADNKRPDRRRCRDLGFCVTGGLGEQIKDEDGRVSILG
jgi:hypothetical protein